MKQPNQSRKQQQHIPGLTGLKRLTTLVLLAALPHIAIADTADLLQLLERAKQSDPAYLAAKNQASADLETENLAKAALLPNLNANVRLEKQDITYDAMGMSVDAKRNPGTYSVTLSQALFRPQAWQSLKQGELIGEIAKLALQRAEQDLMLKVARSYFEVLAAQDELASLLEQKSAVAEQLAFAKANFDVGSATITDQQEAQARFDLVTALEINASNQLATRRLQLESIVGQPVTALAKLEKNITIATPQPNTANEWGQQAANSNLQVQQARLNQLLAKAEIKKAQAGHLPTLDLTAQLVETEQQIFDGNTGRPFDLGVDSTTVGLVMNLPLFSGGGTQAKVRQQAALLDKSRNEAEQATRAATLAGTAAFLGVQSSLAQVRALETAVTSSQLALQSNKTGYEVGVRINIDVLNAQQQLNAAQRDLFKARYSSLINMLELQAAAGQLTPESLKNINQLLVR